MAKNPKKLAAMAKACAVRLAMYKARRDAVIGTTIGRLKILSFFREGRWDVFVCVCACGKRKHIRANLVFTGKTRSCGCLARDLISARNRTHGYTINGTTTTEYNSWAGMRARCLNPQNKAYHKYGGRGITICERWMKFENFIADMGVKASPDLSIERIDNNKGYCPENCKWGTKSEQVKNRRKLMTYEDWLVEHARRQAEQ